MTDDQQIFYLVVVGFLLFPLVIGAVAEVVGILADLLDRKG